MRSRAGHWAFLVFAASACSRHSASCVGRAAGPSPSASAEVAKVLVDLAPEDAGDAGESDAFIDVVRRDAWDEAWTMLETLPDARKQKASIRLVRGRVAMARGDCASALAALAGLEKELSSLADDLEKWRAECQVSVGPFAPAAEYFVKLGGIKNLVRAAVAYDKAGMAAEARATTDKAIGLGKGDANEIAARTLRMRLAEASGQRSVATDDARYVAVRAPASDEAKDALAALSRLDPGHPLTGKERLTRAEKLTDAGLTDEALEELKLAEKAKEPIDDDIAWARAFALYKSRGHYEKASLLFAKLGTKAGPRQAEALFYSARAQSRADHDEEAASGYRAVSHRFSKSPFADEAAYLMARLSFLHAAWNEAADLYREYLRRYPKGKQRDAASYERGIALLASGKYHAARAELHDLAASTTGPSEAARLRELEGVAAEKSGDRASAIALWNDVIRTAPLSFAATLSVARLAQTQTKLPSLIDAADAIASDPIDVKLPPVALLYHRLGLDGDADNYLRNHERDAVAGAKGREKEALCALYEELGRANRLYRIGIDAVPAAVLAKAPSKASEWAWRCVYPRPYRERVRDIEEREALPKGLIYAVMRQESAYDPDAVSGARAVGLLQLMPETARRLAAEIGISFEEKMLRTPSLNLDLGGRYLAKMLKTFGGSVPLAAAAYNAGPRAVRRWQVRMKNLDLDLWVASIPFEETRTYVIKVMSNLARYAFLDGGESAVPGVALAMPSPTEEASAEY